MSEGLSQDDFRKLLATPRRPNNPEETPQFKVPAPKVAVFAAPRSMRKKNFKKPFSKKSNEEDDDDEDEDEQRKSNYRDRAAERRKQGDPSDDSQLSTEELLKRTQAEAGDELDAKQLYEQSKYLGGDVNHTHLVKGLDFALLRKVRTDLEKKQQQQGVEEDIDSEDQKEAEQAEQEEQEDLDQVLEKFERGEMIQDDDDTMMQEEEEQDRPKFHTVLAKNIYDHILQQTTTAKEARVELFEPGRMAFVFELADEVGHYSDAFAIPTAIIRSKTDVSAKLLRSGGWSEETQAETKLVIDKLSQVMEAVRRGDRHHAASISLQQQQQQQTKALTSQPIAVVEDMFMGDIFEDAGTDYRLDETQIEQSKTVDQKKKNYFDGLIQQQEDQDEEMLLPDAVDTLLSQVTNHHQQSEEQDNNNNNKKKRKYNQVEIDADAADIDMFGLSSSALPTSFDEHTAYQSDDDDEEKATTQLIDQGTNKNKKAQLTRWDFDTEEAWQNYKNSIEITPKSAFQFGVKVGDGRNKKTKERRGGLNDKQRLDRDYQQVKNIMSKKYGKSLE